MSFLVLSESVLRDRRQAISSAWLKFPCECLNFSIDSVKSECNMGDIGDPKGRPNIRSISFVFTSPNFIRAVLPVIRDPV